MKLTPLNKNVTLVELKTREVQELTGKALVDVETNKLDVLNYGKIVVGDDDLKTDDIVLYQKLGAHKTNFGTPRQLLIDPEYIEARIDV